MSNNSTTGGYLIPAPIVPLPGSLTLNQFLNTLFVGLSELDGTLVRPKWQQLPPKQPPTSTDWMAFAIVTSTPDANAATYTDSTGAVSTLRHEELEIQCSFYGPDALDIAALVRDGFQVQQNLEALRAANMGFKGTSNATHVPDLINEQWVERVEMSVTLRREIQRVYPILSFLSAKGTINSVVGNEPYLVAWNT